MSTSPEDCAAVLAGFENNTGKNLNQLRSLQHDATESQLDDHPLHRTMAYKYTEERRSTDQSIAFTTLFPGYTGGQKILFPQPP